MSCKHNSEERADANSFPKLLSAAYVEVSKTGIAHAILVPSKVSIELGDNVVTIDCNTTYPFGNGIFYTINATKSFSFYIRVPEWANTNTSSIVVLGGEQTSLKPDQVNGLHQISIPAGTTKISYTLGAGIIVKPRANDTVSISHGALLYAIDIPANLESSWPIGYKDELPIPEKWLTPKARDDKLLNTMPWNIAIDPTTLRFLTSNDGDSLPDPIFTSGSPPGYMLAKGCHIAWGLFRGTAAPPPLVGNRECLGESFEVKLIPYGAAKLHMAELPTVDLRVRTDKKMLLQGL